MARAPKNEAPAVYDETQIAALKREMAAYAANGDTAAAGEVAAQLRKVRANAPKEDTSADNADVETA